MKLGSGTYSEQTHPRDPATGRLTPVEGVALPDRPVAVKIPANQLEVLDRMGKGEKSKWLRRVIREALEREGKLPAETTHDPGAIAGG